MVDFVTKLGIFGIPSIFSMVVYAIGKTIVLTKKINILMKAQQAQMRTQLLEQYHRYEAQGWISEEDLEDWENQYQGYHSLGKNGIMDARREKLIAMPNVPQ